MGKMGIPEGLMIIGIAKKVATPKEVATFLKELIVADQ